MAESLERQIKYLVVFNYSPFVSYVCLNTTNHRHFKFVFKPSESCMYQLNTGILTPPLKIDDLVRQPEIIWCIMRLSITPKFKLL